MVVLERKKEEDNPKVSKNISKIKWVFTFLNIGLLLSPFVYFIYIEYVANIINQQPSSNGELTECQGNGDESFIRSKMSQLDRDILELNKVGDRKYYVRYINWSSGSAVNGDEILDYSNSPCND
jgi:hypothetical protein